MGVARWMTYLRRRFLLTAALGAGMALSASRLGTGRIVLTTSILTFVGILLFFAVLRLMDELKDYRTDLIAHPDRPLPRGILTGKEVSRTIDLGQILMVAYGIAMGSSLGEAAGAWYLLGTLYVRLVYRDFYLRDRLRQYPLPQRLLEQGALVPLGAFCLLAYRPGWAGSGEPYLFGGFVMGAFFVREVCRRLDPGAEPVLRTFRQMHGLLGCFALICVAALQTIVCATPLGLGWVASLSGFAVVVSFALVVRHRHRWVAWVACAALVAQMWAAVWFDTGRSS